MFAVLFLAKNLRTSIDVGAGAFSWCKIHDWFFSQFCAFLMNCSARSEHSYIIGYYNPSVRIIDLVSHTTYVVCVNFIHKWRDLQFKVDSERQIF